MHNKPLFVLFLLFVVFSGCIQQKPLSGTLIPTEEKDVIFGTCKNSSCGEGLICDDSSDCGPPETSTKCTSIGDKKCYLECSSDFDCQQLCNTRMNCAKYYTTCSGEILLVFGDTLSPKKVCHVFRISE